MATPHSESAPLSPFQEQVARDFTETFLNLEEFGRTVKWNGRDLLCTFGASPPPAESDEAPGILIKTRVLICRSQDLPRLPKANEAVTLNGETWFVMDPQEAPGHFIITLARQTS
ncbi:MAG: hypothetical protein LUC93_03090 [Planctomycetaceae bacterium]|nr:hypothetical protein [Planctomycetaceae bacterium]